MQDDSFYVCSFSNLVTIYKGLCMPAICRALLSRSGGPAPGVAICLFHQRFSTNTVPRWPLAQPFRYLAHNGEINTITGNRQWARARTYKFPNAADPGSAGRRAVRQRNRLRPSSLDNMLELLLAGGMDLIRAMRLLVPPAWQNNRTWMAICAPSSTSTRCTWSRGTARRHRDVRRPLRRL